MLNFGFFNIPIIGIILGLLNFFALFRIKSLPWSILAMISVAIGNLTGWALPFNLFDYSNITSYSNIYIFF